MSEARTRASAGAAPPASAGAPLRREVLAAAAILIAAAAVRFYGIGREPLWLDEGYSWWDARQPLADLWRLVPQCDPHPPLYALLLKGWAAFAGDSADALRALGATLGVAATGLVMLAGRELGPRVGWIAGVLFAVAPFQIEHAHEARPYSLVALGAAALACGALRVLRDPGAPVGGARAGWAMVVAGAAVMLWSSNTAVFHVGALALFAAALVAADRSSRPLLRPMLAAGAVIVAVWLPYVPVYLEQARGISADFWIPRPDAWRVANELRFVVGLGGFLTLWLLLGIWTAGVAMLWRRGLQRHAALLVALVALPVAMNLAVSLTIKPIYLARALIGISPPFALGLACALAAIRLSWLRVGGVALLAAARLAAAASLYFEDNRKEPWDDVAAYLLREAPPGALVLLVPNELALPLGHALDEAEAEAAFALHGVPADFPAPGLARARYPSGKCTPAVTGQDLAPLAAAARGRPEVVLVSRRNNVYDPGDRTQALLGSIGMVEASRREFQPGEIVVHRFVATGTRAATRP